MDFRTTHNIIGTSTMCHQHQKVLHALFIAVQQKELNDWDQTYH